MVWLRTFGDTVGGGGEQKKMLTVILSVSVACGRGRVSC